MLEFVIIKTLFIRLRMSDKPQIIFLRVQKQYCQTYSKDEYRWSTFPFECVFLNITQFNYV